MFLNVVGGGTYTTVLPKVQEKHTLIYARAPYAKTARQNTVLIPYRVSTRLLPYCGSSCLRTDGHDERNLFFMKIALRQTLSEYRYLVFSTQCQFSLFSFAGDQGTPCIVATEKRRFKQFEFVCGVISLWLRN
jgi:hypothetical protein